MTATDFCCLSLILALCSPMFGDASRLYAAGPLSLEKTIADLHVPPGLRVELMAAEPDVVDPVAIAFDEIGRMWVVEMRDYPVLSPGQQPESRIRVLRDRDGDGRYESATTFAEGLLFPTGIQPWRGGAIVTLAGEVAYFPDANHDDRADGKEVWYRGFATENEQLRANHPTLGIDGRIYVAGGLRGGNIVDARAPDAPAVSINGRDFAFDPVGGGCQAVTGNGQFGLTFDDFGRRFTCSNRNPLVQVMIEQRYLQQNSNLVLPTVVHDVAAAGESSRVFPRTRTFTTAPSHGGQFTAACGVEIFRGDALPAEYRGNAFVCEPTANLVHRKIVDTSGPAFTSQPASENGEFLTSGDEWFRPVNLATGPDGALYVVDMYRAVIEHPAWMPVELRKRPDLWLGNDRGRIYRIVADTPRTPTSINPAQEPHDLLKLLEHPNTWQRDTAARLIREAGNCDAEQLRTLAMRSELAATRCVALWLLNGQSQLDDSTLLHTLNDSSPQVREQAIVISERRLARSPSLAQRVIDMSGDADPRVRNQVALSLSMLPAARTVSPLVKIAVRDAADEWTCRAVALAARESAGSVLAGVLRQVGAGGENGVVGVLKELSASIAASGEETQIIGALAQAKNLDAHFVGLLTEALGNAVEARGLDFGSLLARLEQVDPAASEAIERAFSQAIVVPNDDRLEPAIRMSAVRLLRYCRRTGATETLLRLMQHESQEFKIAAIAALAGRNDPQIAEAAVAEWSGSLPMVRRALLDLLLTDHDATLALLKALEAERIAVTEIDAVRIQRLKEHPDASVRSRAEELLGGRVSDRGETMRQYRPALELTPDLTSGRKVFSAQCAACHRLGGEGTVIGPDIGDSALRSREQLLADILQPNLAVDANYVSYTAVTHDGRVHQGVIRTESDAGIALTTPEGKTVTILRADLESLHSNGVSLMPEGLERQISLQQMADVIGYIRNWRELANGEPVTPGGK